MGVMEGLIVKVGVRVAVAVRVEVKVGEGVQGVKLAF